MRLLEGTCFDRPPLCERCGVPESDCRCPPEVVKRNVVPPEKQTAKLSIEKRKKGKVVTVVRGLSAADNDLSALLTRLKNQLGVGGTVEDETLELQGDQLERLKKVLGDLGYKVR